MDFRTRIDLYLWSGNGDKSATNGSGEVRFYNLRPQGYLFDPSKYHGCIVSLGSFQSLPMKQTGYDGIVGANSKAGAAVHFQVLDVSQPNSITNFNSSSAGVSTYSSNAKILKTLQWSGETILIGNGAVDNQYALTYRASDPIAEGVFVSYPLEEMTVRLINSSGAIVDLSDVVEDTDGSDIDCNWSAHIIVQPILKD